MDSNNLDGSDLTWSKKQTCKNGTSWRWFLAGTFLLNLTVTSLILGLMFVYVRVELQAVKDQLLFHDDRLALLEKPTLTNDATPQQHTETNDQSMKKVQLRVRRDHKAPTSSEHRANGSWTFRSEIDQPHGLHCPVVTCHSGKDGKDGRDGVDGRDGRDGRNGHLGSPSEPGQTGEQGPPGERGPPGEPGQTGEPGPPGKPGPQGEKGDVGSAGPQGQKDDPVDIDSLIRAYRPSGPTYIRWGRTTCPNHAGTELVYQGYGAGSHFAHKGGSVDLFCLPTDPDVPPSYRDGFQSNSQLHGMEYQVSLYDPFSHENSAVIHDHDVPCAVCRLTSRGTRVLFPAKNDCPDNWTKEYNGYLMSNHHNQARQKAVCVDKAPEVIPGTQANDNGALLYLTEAACGSLQCPPYVEGREISCAICSI